MLPSPLFLRYIVRKDEAAQDFCRPFYEALITKTYTVQQAFDIAVSTVNANPRAGTATFILLPEGEHSRINRLRFILALRPSCIERP